MKIIVCIKQVPLISRLQFNNETKTVIRTGVPLDINTFDLRAAVCAVQLKDAFGAEVIVLTMGPPSARDALITCLALGCDRGIHLSDPIFAGSDTLATARTLSLVILQESPDLILCGRNSIDAETGQVGPQIAEFLDLPHISRATQLQIDIDNSHITVHREADEGLEILRCSMPALISAAESIAPEKYPSPEELTAATDKTISTISATELMKDTTWFGSKGSPTWVSDIHTASSNREAIVFRDEDPQSAADHLLEKLREHRISSNPGPQIGSRSHSDGGTDDGIWVVSERVNNQIRHTTYELLGKAYELAMILHKQVSAIVLEPINNQETNHLGAYGADRVYILDGNFDHYISPRSAHILSSAISKYQPHSVLFPSTANGRDFAARVAARLSLGLTGDCIGLQLNEHQELIQLKPALGGNVVAPIYSKTRPYLATVRPGVFALPIPAHNRLPLRIIVPDTNPNPSALAILERQMGNDTLGVNLEQARIVLAVGMGIGGSANLPKIYHYAKSIGASIAATRDVTDAGWIPKQLQVGLSGRSIAPDLYIAVGIRGVFNHMVGIQKAGIIIAINNNPRAPITKAADYTVVGDWEIYLPTVLEAIKTYLTINNNARSGPSNNS